MPFNNYKLYYGLSDYAMVSTNLTSAYHEAVTTDVVKVASTICTTCDIYKMSGLSHTY